MYLQFSPMVKVILAAMVGMLIGFFIGQASSSYQEREEIERLAEKEEISRAGHFERNSKDGGRRTARREDESNKIMSLEDLSGLSTFDENQSLVVVSTSLLEKLAARKGNQTLKEDLFSQDGELEEILQITDQEKEKLQGAWKEARQIRRKLEVSRSEAERLSDGSVKITVPGLAQEVADIGNSFYEQLVLELGDNRASAFASLRQLDSAFQLLNEESKYTVKVESTGDGGWRYKMSVQGPSGSKSWVGESIPESIRHLAEAADIPVKLEVAEEE